MISTIRRGSTALAIVLLVISLSGCGSLGQKSPEVLPTVILDQGQAPTQAPSLGGQAGAVASGIVVPGQEAKMAAAAAGKIDMLDVKAGEKVAAGDVLVRLAGAEQLQAALSAADLEVLNAEQNLKKLNDDLLEDQTAALLALMDARQGLRDAQQRIAGFGIPSEPIDVQVARSNVALAKKALDQAKKDFLPYENKPENNLRRAGLLSKLSDAQNQYDNTVEQLNRLTGVFVPEFDMQQAQSELEIAQNTLKLAEDEYEKLQSGPDPDALELAQARLKGAQDQRESVRASLANLELKAPFSGTISKVNFHADEWVLPGQTILVLDDLDNLRIETTDLSENDVPNIEIGQAVTVFIKALNQSVTGRLSEISPLADTLGGDVVYKTSIDLDEPTPGLRAGMSVEVQF